MWATLFAFAVINFSLCEMGASAATTAAPTSHIVSFVKQKKNKVRTEQQLSEFDVKTLHNAEQMPHSGVQPHSFARLVQQLDANFNLSVMPTKNNSTKLIANETDDSPNIKQNKLENSNDIFGHNDQHESPMTTAVANGSVSTGLWNRAKQSIPVLQPVKDLLNTVRDGAFNHTVHPKNNQHHLVDPSEHTPQTDSPVIETEEEREMVNEGTNLKLLEVLGTIGGMIWGFLTNIQKVFAASSGNASASASSSSSGGSQ